MPKQKTRGRENRNESRTLALGQKVGANANIWVMPTGMRTAEKTRLKASNGDNSRTRPVALRTKCDVEPPEPEPLSMDIGSLLKYVTEQYYNTTSHSTMILTIKLL